MDNSRNPNWPWKQSVFGNVQENNSDPDLLLNKNEEKRRKARSNTWETTTNPDKLFGDIMDEINQKEAGNVPYASPIGYGGMFSNPKKNNDNGNVVPPVEGHGLMKPTINTDSNFAKNQNALNVGLAAAKPFWFGTNKPDNDDNIDTIQLDNLAILDCNDNTGASSLRGATVLENEGAQKKFDMNDMKIWFSQIINQELEAHGRVTFNRAYNLLVLSKPGISDTISKSMAFFILMHLASDIGKFQPMEGDLENFEILKN